MKITVVLHEPTNPAEYDRKRFFMEDEGELTQTLEDIERYLSDQYFEMNEEV